MRTSMVPVFVLLAFCCLLWGVHNKRMLSFSKLDKIEKRISELETTLNERDQKIKTLSNRLNDLGGWDAIIEYNKQLLQTEAITFSKKVVAQPYGVLGQRLLKNGKFVNGVGASPQNMEPCCCIVDPAGLQHIQPPGGPSGAGGAAGAIYKWLGISNNQTFAKPIIKGIKETGHAKYHCYHTSNYGPIHVIHAVGPDLRKPTKTGEVTREEAIMFLSEAYHNVFREFLFSGQDILRLLPISGGIFSGNFGHEIHRMTWEAVQGGYSLLDETKRSVLSRHPIHLCIFAEDEMDDFLSVGFEAGAPPPVPASKPPPPPPTTRPPPPIAPPPPPPSPKVYEDNSNLVGKHIVVHGLVKRPEMNGVTGLVTGFDPENGRYAVSVLVNDIEKIAKLKVENITEIPPPPPPAFLSSPPEVPPETQEPVQGASLVQEESKTGAVEQGEESNTESVEQGEESNTKAVEQGEESNTKAVEQGEDIKTDDVVVEQTVEEAVVEKEGTGPSKGEEDDDWELVQSPEPRRDIPPKEDEAVVANEGDDGMGDAKKKKKKSNRRGGKKKKKKGANNEEGSDSISEVVENEVPKEAVAIAPEKTVPFQTQQEEAAVDDETLRKQLKPLVSAAEAKAVMLKLWPWVGSHAELSPLNSYDDVNFLVQAFDIETPNDPNDDETAFVSKRVLSGVNRDQKLTEESKNEPNRQKILANADELKGRANKLFQKSLFQEAIDGYTQALELYEVVSISMEGSPHLENTVKTYNNRALCYFKLGRYEMCVESCDAALELDPSFTKALYRRATALNQIQDWGRLRKDALVLNNDHLTSLSVSETSFLTKALGEANEKIPPKVTKFTLKIHNGVESRSPDVIDMQDEMLVYLNKKGVQAPLPQPTVNQTTHNSAAVEEDDEVQVMSASKDAIQYLGLYQGLASLPVRGKDQEKSTCPLAIRLLSWVEGDIMGNCEFGSGLIRDAGKYLGRISKSLSSFRHPSARRVHAWDVKRSLGLRDFIHCLEPEKQALVAEVLDTFESQVLPVSKMLPSSVIMGDFNDANIIVSDSSNGGGLKVVGMIDVGDMVHTWRVNEVAIAAAYALLTDYGKSHHTEAAAELLSGFNEVCGLEMLELTLFKTLVACRLACSYTMGMYSYSKDQTNHYLLKHAKPAGEMLEKWWKD